MKTPQVYSTSKHLQTGGYTKHFEYKIIHKIMKLLLLALAFFIGLCGAEKCMHPPPSPNYNNELYSGRWYEVGKYQTFGGAIFQRGTVCTIATYAPYNLESGGGDIGEIKGLKLGADIFLRIYFRSKQNVCMFYTYTQMGKDCNGFFLPP